MAGEKRGLLYEAVTMVALKLAIQKIDLNTQIFWNKKPEKMSVVPDFTLGQDINKPTHVILVTASRTVTGTDKKFWRNAGELQEVKSQLEGIPIVINIFFRSLEKKGLNQATQQFYDTVLHVDYKDYFQVIQNWVQQSIGANSQNYQSRVSMLESSMLAEPELADAIGLLSDDLASALKTRNNDLQNLWQLMRSAYTQKHKIPRAKQTFIRRGLGKLLVIEPSIRKKIYQNIDSHASYKGLPEYVFDLSFFSKVLGGARLIDSEVTTTVSSLGEDICEKLLQKAPPIMSEWVDTLRNLTRIEWHVDFVEKNFTEILDPNSLHKMLKACFYEPSTLLGKYTGESLWLYNILLSLIKAKSGKFQGYGLAKLDTDMQKVADGAEYPRLRFMIPRFTKREKLPDTDTLFILAQALSQRVATDLSVQDVSSLKKQVKRWVIKELLEDRLIPYRNFEPLMWLLELELANQNKRFATKEPYMGWMNEYTGLGRKVATTPLIRVDETFIHWKTGTNFGRVHKKKELSARSRNLKYQYNPLQKKFSQRASIKKLVLIVDGEFTDDDLRVLVESGWDRIIYPDEIADFVKSL